MGKRRPVMVRGGGSGVSHRRRARAWAGVCALLLLAGPLASRASAQNIAPWGNVTPSTTTPRINEAVTFTWGAWDSDGIVVSVQLDFGDGTVVPLAPAGPFTIDHTYLAPDRYRVTLTVTDDGGASTAIDQWLFVSDASGCLPIVRFLDPSAAGPGGAMAINFGGAIGGNGQTVAFLSTAVNLVPGDTADGFADLFIHDLESGAVWKRTAEWTGGGAVNGDTLAVALDHDASAAAFSSLAWNLVPGETNDGLPDIYYVLVGGGTPIISKITRAAVGGGPANGPSSGPAIGGNGRFVVFQSAADNLISTDIADGVADIFLWDKFTLTITKVTKPAGGGVANGDSGSNPDISSDGRYVVFESYASNLVPGDVADGMLDLYLWDRYAGTTTKITHGFAGGGANDHSQRPRVSRNGEYVAFSSLATNLVAGDTPDTVHDVFLWERATDTVTKVKSPLSSSAANGASGIPSISDDGRYVAFGSDATNLLPGDPVDSVNDVYIWARDAQVLRRVTLSRTGASPDGGSGFPQLTATGSHLVFDSAAHNLVPGAPAPPAGDVYYAGNCLYNPPPQVTLTATPPTGPAGSGFLLQAQVVDPGDTVANYMWDFGDGTIDPVGAPDALRDYPIPGFYTAAVTVTDSAGGAGTARIEIEATDPGAPPCPPVEKVSWAAGGGPATFSSDMGAVSADGRYVVFVSSATNLVPGDIADSVNDVFLWDRLTKTMTKVTRDLGDVGANGFSWAAAISADGRYVAIESDASNLVPDDRADGNADIYLWDRITATFTKVSKGYLGATPNASSYDPAISADGRYVAFTSYASNLTPGDTPDVLSDIFVWDSFSGQIEKITNGTAGTGADGDSAQPAISADGRYIAFASTATNLTTGVTIQPWQDIFLWDRLFDSTSLVSRSANGVTSADALCASPAVSADGVHVVYESDADNLVPLDSIDGHTDIFSWDREVNATVKVSRSPGGGIATGQSALPAISADGRYIVYHSAASNLVPGGSPAGIWNVFVWDRVPGTHAVLASGLGGAPPNADLSGAAISADARWVTFVSLASNLVAGDVSDGVTDLFLARNCSLAGGPGISWAVPPPRTAVGRQSLPMMWSLAGFGGPVTDNQVHFGITSVLGSSDIKPGTNAVHAHAFTAPNIGTFDSPREFVYIVRALDNGTQQLSPLAPTLVSASTLHPDVQWVTPPPASIPSGSQFTVSWQLTNFENPVTANALGWGITTLLGQTLDQPGGNGLYTAYFDVPVVTNPGTLYFTAFAQNTLEFAFAPVMPVNITVP